MSDLSLCTCPVIDREPIDPDCIVHAGERPEPTPEELFDEAMAKPEPKPGPRLRLVRHAGTGR